MTAVNILIKPSSSLCNMRCEYCFYCDEARKRTIRSFGMMSENTLKNVIRKTILKADRFINYAFQGGEPTLCGIPFFEKVLAFQRQYNKKKIEVHNSIQTNGYAIDEKWCHFFKENNFLVGVSIDGIPEVHNRWRHGADGKDTYYRIEHSLELLREYGVEFNILTVVTPEIVKNVKDIYSHYKEKGWRYQQYIPCLDPLGEEHGKNKYALKPEEYGEFLVKLFQLWYTDLNYGRQPYIREFDNYIAMAAGYRSESCSQCGRCSVQTVVEADGSVYPCDFYVLDKFYLGNLNTNQLEEIYREPSVRQFVEESLKITSECKKCRFYNLCRGGCHRNRDWNAEKGIYENYFCKSYKIFFEKNYDTLLNIGAYLKKNGV